MKVILSPKASKQLQKLQIKEGLKVTGKLRLLEQHPFSGKPLAGQFKGYYSLRSWPYRIVYEIFKEKRTVLIDTIEHRQRVYK